MCRQLCCIRPYLDSTTASTIATSIVHSKLDYCNSLYYNLPKSQITHLQQIQNSLARAVVKAPRSCHINPILCSLHWLNITKHIKYKLLSLTHKVLTTTQPSYLRKLISVQPCRSTHSSSVITLTWPPTSSSLCVTDCCFRYASPCLDQLPSSLCQPHSSPSVCDLPVHAPATSSDSHQLTTLTIHNSLCLLPSQDLPISQIFPTIDSLWPQDWLHRLYDWTISSEHLVFCFFSLFIALFCLVLCSRLSCLCISFWAHVNIHHVSEKNIHSCYWL